MVLMLMVILMAVTINSYAYDALYMRRFLKQEIDVTIIVALDRTKVIHLYLKKVDYNTNIIIGKTNSGNIHIPIDKIILINVTDPTVHSIHNTHR